MSCAATALLTKSDPLLSRGSNGVIRVLPLGEAMVVSVTPFLHSSLGQNKQLFSTDKQSRVSQTQLEGTLVDLLFKWSQYLLLASVEVLPVNAGVFADQIFPFRVPHARDEGTWAKCLLDWCLVINELIEVTTIGIVLEIWWEVECLRR